MEAIKAFIDKYFKLSTISFAWNDALEIVIFAFIIYYVILWIKRSRAWMLLKGACIIVVVYMVASVLQLNNLLFVFHYITTYVVIGMIVILQPEIRNALEQLGKNAFLSNILSIGTQKDTEDLFVDETIDILVKTAYTLGKSKTGALIVLEKKIVLDEYIATGISMNADISFPLLVQIFEHNTPLHDGAVIMRGNKILSATCYLPMSDNRTISKELGTRHRAGLGISEVSDSITIIVSEETGNVTIAKDGKLYRKLEPEEMRTILKQEQKKAVEPKKKSSWKERMRDAGKNKTSSDK